MKKPSFKWTKITGYFAVSAMLLPFLSLSIAFASVKNSGWFSSTKTIYLKSEYRNEFSVLVILNEEESKLFKEYSNNELGINSNAEIFDLTSSYKNLICCGEYENDECFKRILKIKFKNKVECFNFINKKPKPYFIESIELCEDKRGYMFSTYPSEKYNNTSFYSNQYYLDIIHAPQAWDIQTGSTNTMVGLLDTGVYATHNELSNNQISSSLSSTVNGTTNSPTSDLNGHGTFNAGIIGATTNVNNNGIAGICWNVSLISIRADNPMNPSYDERVEDIISGLNYANSINLKILNYSGGFSTESLALKQAIQNFNGLLVVASGNANSNLNTTVCYPSSWNLPNVISVGASNQNNEKANISNYGSSVVDLFAPGINITSLGISSNNSYSTSSGTSHAAPMVTAAAALLLSEYPSMDTNSLKKSILDNVTQISGLSDYCKTGGILNIYAALSNPHTHSYTDHFTYSNTTKHKAYCSCGKYILQTHMWDFGNTWMVGSKLYGTCFHCEGGFPL